MSKSPVTGDGSSPIGWTGKVGDQSGPRQPYSENRAPKIVCKSFVCVACQHRTHWNSHFVALNVLHYFQWMFFLNALQDDGLPEVVENPFF
jgi:hypothetical protein